MDQRTNIAGYKVRGKRLEDFARNYHRQKPLENPDPGTSPRNQKKALNSFKMELHQIALGRGFWRCCFAFFKNTASVRINGNLESFTSSNGAWLGEVRINGMWYHCFELFAGDVIETKWFDPPPSHLWDVIGSGTTTTTSWDGPLLSLKLNRS